MGGLWGFWWHMGPCGNINDVEVIHDYVDNKQQRFIPRKNSNGLREEDNGHTKQNKLFNPQDSFNAF